MRQEADTVASIGRLESAIPESMVFRGPAASRFRANADEVAESLFVAQRILDAAAEDLERRARQIEHAQAEHDRARGGLLDDIADLSRQIARVAR
jgi:predicted phage gp36 major capsid-like protein